MKWMDCEVWFPRFNQKVRKDGPNGCWRWLGTHFANGYAAFWLHGQNRLASRVSYEVFIGEVGESDVLHHCDNPDCVNPEHLYLGTHSDNMQDRERRQRANHPHGERHTKALLTETQVRQIQQQFVPRTDSATRLARTFHVSKATIYSIVRGINWKHVGECSTATTDRVAQPSPSLQPR